MKDIIANLKQTLVTAKPDQKQREALVDALVWTMYSDGTIAYEENERVDMILDELDGGTTLPLSQYLPTAVSRIRDVWTDPDATGPALDALYVKLGTDELRAAALSLCEALAHADGEMAEQEQQFLERLRKRFNLGA